MKSKHLKVSLLLINCFILFSISLKGQNRYLIYPKSGQVIEATKVSFRNPSILGEANIKIKAPIQKRLEGGEIDSVRIIKPDEDILRVPVQHLTRLYWGEAVLNKNGVKVYEISVTTQSSMGGMGPNNMPTYAPTQQKIQYYSIDGNPLKLAKRANLKEDLQGNREALEALNKSRGLTIARIALYSLGGVLVVSGIINASNDDLPSPEASGPPASVFIGAGLISTASILSFFKGKNYLDALSTYANTRY